LRGCLTFFAGVVVGVVLFAIVDALVVSPPPLAQAPPPNTDLTILFHNDYLTRELQSQVAQVNSPVTLKQPVIQGQADQTLVVAGTASVPGLPASAPIRVVVRPTVSNNRVAVQIANAQIGGLKLPGNWFAPFESQINENLNRTLANTPYRVVGVSTTVEGLLVNVVVTR
jgi:hypothetical protein